MSTSLLPFAIKPRQRPLLLPLFFFFFALSFSILFLSCLCILHKHPAPSSLHSFSVPDHSPARPFYNSFFFFSTHFHIPFHSQSHELSLDSMQPKFKQADCDCESEMDTAGYGHRIAADGDDSAEKFAAQKNLGLQQRLSSRPRLNNVVNIIRLPVEAQAAILNRNAGNAKDSRESVTYAGIHRRRLVYKARVHSQNIKVAYDGNEILKRSIGSLYIRSRDDYHHNVAYTSNNGGTLSLVSREDPAEPESDRSKNDTLQSRVETNHIRATDDAQNVLLLLFPNRSRVIKPAPALANTTSQSDSVSIPPQPNTRSTAAERKRWLQKYWDNITILHQDEVSERFASRMNVFLTGRSSEDSNLDDGGCEMQFFMTWFAPLKDYGPREQLALESVFRSHPTACVVMLSRTFDSFHGALVLNPFIRKGFRIVAITPDIHFLANSTPAEKWFHDLKQGLIDPGGIAFNQNLSNLIRLLVLYKYGGIYIDTDIVVMRNFGNLSNVIGAQSADSITKQWSRLNNAVMIFEKKSPVVWQFITEFAVTFNGNKWGHNGPYLLTRVMLRMKQQQQQECRVLEPLAFYPVDWHHIHSFFQAPNNTDDKIRHMSLPTSSYSVHLWNKISKSISIQPNSIMDSIFLSTCVFCDNTTYYAALTGHVATIPASSMQIQSNAHTAPRA